MVLSIETHKESTKINKLLLELIDFFLFQSGCRVQDQCLKSILFLYITNLKNVNTKLRKAFIL